MGDNDKDEGNMETAGAASKGVWEKVSTFLHLGNKDSLGLIETAFGSHVRGLPLSYLAMYYTRREDLRIIAASSVFMEKFHYASPEDVTFSNVFGGLDKPLFEQVQNAFIDPLHRAFSIPLLDGSHEESLVYVAKRGTSNKDIPLSYFPSRRYERHCYLFVEMNKVGVIEKDRRGCFKRCEYIRPKKIESAYDIIVNEQIRVLENVNKKRDRPVIWDLC